MTGDGESRGAVLFEESNEGEFMPNTWIDKYTDDPEKRLSYAVAKLAHAVQKVSGGRGRTYLRKLEFGKELDGLSAAFHNLKRLHKAPEVDVDRVEHAPGSCAACVVLEERDE